MKNKKPKRIVMYFNKTSVTLKYKQRKIFSGSLRDCEAWLSGWYNTEDQTKWNVRNVFN